MIRVQQISKIYNTKGILSFKKQDDVVAVDNIDFECKPRRIFGLIGPNGAGKTTTLRMIATMLKPSSGNILVNDFDVCNEPLHVRRSLGFLSGNTGLYDRLTANEMVKYYGDLHQLNSNEFKRNRDKIFSLLDMEEFATRRISKLSTGMQQKVNIARTMIHDPSVIVFDEPTSGLDVMTSRNIIQLIQNCKDSGKTVIFSSHRLEEIKMLCDDMAIIHKGKLYFNGTYNEFEGQMTEKTLQDEFIKLVNHG